MQIIKRWRGLGAAVAVARSLSLVPAVAAASPCDDPDPDWLLCEDFEAGALGWDAWFDQSQWVECDGCPNGTNDPERIRLEQDASLAHDGEFTVHMPGGASAGYRGGTLRFATCNDSQQSGCSLQGYDRLHFRTWVRLAADHDYVHHFLGLGGSRPDAYWEANGNAGCRPNGERWAGTRVDLNPAHELFFYTYFPDMNCDSGGYCSGSYAESICDGCAEKDMPCSDGLECCWGNHFEPAAPVVVPTEEWTCIEMMMQLNTPGSADGSMAFWVNDELAHQQDGMSWRDVPELQLNRAMLEHYIDTGDTDHENRVWFDDVVVSPSPIGCGAGGGPGGEDTGGGSGPAADGGGGGGGDTTGADPTAPGEGGGGDAASVTGGGGDDGATDGGTSLGAGTEGSAGQKGASDDGGGCACRADRDGDPAGLAWLLLGAIAVPRRGRRGIRTVAAVAGSVLALGCASSEEMSAPAGGESTAGPEDASTGAPGSTPGDPAGSSSEGPADPTSEPTGDSAPGTDEGSTAAPSDGDETGPAGCVEYDPFFYDGFESYAPEESLSGGNPFGAAGRTRATDAVVHTGARAARMEIRPEDDGGFGQWGGTLGLPDLGVGRSVWVRFWVQWPADFEFSAAPWMKFVRLHNITAEGENGGYNDLYVDQADGPDSVLRTIKEVHDVWEVYDGPVLPRDQWERYEIQIVVDHVPVDDGGEARFRVWRDDALIFDRTDVPTITAPGGTLDYLYLFTYWNNEMPPNNAVYIDELAIALDDAPLPATDAEGNPVLGDWVPCRP